MSQHYPVPQVDALLTLPVSLSKLQEQINEIRAKAEKDRNALSAMSVQVRTLEEQYYALRGSFALFRRPAEELFIELVELRKAAAARKKRKRDRARRRRSK